jgi:protein SCO1/2
MKILAAAVAGAFLVLAGCAPREPLPVLGEVPRFELTSQDGGAFDSAALAGHVWVADFFFTSCPGPCPRMSGLFKSIQAQSPSVRLVSFTVDPDRDTPTVLADYATHFQAERGRWFMLTGTREQLNRMGLDVFHLNSVDGSLQHSTRFALVDRQGRIRGYYATSEDGFLNRLLRDVRNLERERR